MAQKRELSLVVNSMQLQTQALPADSPATLSDFLYHSECDFHYI